MFSNQLTIVVINGEVEEDIEVKEVDIIPDVREELGCYHWVNISLYFIMENGVYKREEQLGVDTDPDAEGIEHVVLNDERERHWRIGFEEKNGGVDGTKDLLHTKDGGVYN